MAAGSEREALLSRLIRTGTKPDGAARAEACRDLMKACLEVDDLSGASRVAAAGRSDADPDAALSPVEAQVCFLLRRGMTSPDVADLLGIALGTVETHRFNIRRKNVACGREALDVRDVAAETGTSGLEAVSTDGLLVRMERARDTAARHAIVREVLRRLRDVDAADGIGCASAVLSICNGARDLEAAALAVEARSGCYVLVGKRSAAGDDLEYAYRVHVDAERNVDAARVALRLGRMRFDEGGLSAAKSWYEVADERLASLDPLMIGPAEARVRSEAMNALGELRARLGAYEEALTLHLRALALLEGQGGRHDSDGRRVAKPGADADGGVVSDDRDHRIAIGNTLVALARLYDLLGKDGSALEVLVRARAMFREAGDRYNEVRTIVQAATALIKLGDMETAHEQALTALAIYEALHDGANIGATLMLIGTIHERRAINAGRREELDVALQYQIRAHDILTQIGDEQSRVRVLVHIGRLYGETGDNAAAQFVFEQALSIAQQINDLAAQQQLHEALAHVYESMGDLRRALGHSRLYARIREDLIGEEMQKRGAELQARFDFEKAEREKRLVEQRTEELQDQVRELQERLRAKGLELIERNRMLEKLRRAVETLAESTQGTTASQARALLRDVADAMRAGEQEEPMVRELNEIDADWIAGLTGICPALAQAELIVCWLIKTGFSNKQIATRLGIVVRTVETHRLNIRRKLNLKSGGNLGAFLTGL